MIRLHWKQLGTSLALAGALGLSACGGGGGGGDPVDAGPSVDEVACGNVEGFGDPLQDGLLQLAEAASALPAGSEAVAGLTNAVTAMINVLESFGTSVETLATTQDPEAFAADAEGMSGALDCGAGELESGLIALAGSVGAGTPAEGTINTLLVQVATLQTTLGTDPLAGGVPSDLTALTNALNPIAASLVTLSNQLAAESGVPEAQLVAVALSAAITDVVTLLNETSQLDAAGTAAAMTAINTHVLSNFSPASLAALGIDNAEFQAAAAQVVAGAATANAAMGDVVLQILAPVFEAIATVLAGAGGAGTFEETLAGILGDSPVDGALGDLLVTLAGGGTAPDLGVVLDLLLGDLIDLL